MTCCPKIGYKGSAGNAAGPVWRAVFIGRDFLTKKGRQAMAVFLPYFYLVLAILFEVIATTSLKASDTLTRPVPTVIMLVSYLVCFVFMSLVMRWLPVGVTYALWSGLGIVLITLVAWYRFGEVLDGPALIGIGLIIAGIVVIQVFSRSSLHQ